jgi:hypothetical protein
MKYPSFSLTLILSHQGRGKQEKWEKVRVRAKFFQFTTNNLLLTIFTE